MFCKKSVLKNSYNWQEKTFVGVFIFAGLRPATLLKRDSVTGVFLSVLQNFSKHLFYWTPPVAASSNLKASGFTAVVMQMNFSKLVTIYFTSTFSVPVGIFVFVFSKHKLCCYISTALWLRKYDVFDFSGDHTTEVPRDFLDGAPSFWFSTLPSFRGHGPCECGDKTFLICHVTTWLMCHVTL